MAHRTGEHARGLAGLDPICGLQVRYNLVNRDVERELLPVADALGLSVAAWGPLAGGLLSGKFRSGLTPESGTRVSAESIAARDQAVYGDSGRLVDGR